MVVAVATTRYSNVPLEAGSLEAEILRRTLLKDGGLQPGELARARATKHLQPPDARVRANTIGSQHVANFWVVLSKLKSGPDLPASRGTLL